MTGNEFRLLLEAAVCGDREALDSLLALYMPLINRLSSYAGNLDEDCRQYIMLHIVLHISEFRQRLRCFAGALIFSQSIRFCVFRVFLLHEGNPHFQ